jgi:hypothetical protein
MERFAAFGVRPVKHALELRSVDVSMGGAVDLPGEKKCRLREVKYKRIWSGGFECRFFPDLSLTPYRCIVSKPLFVYNQYRKNLGSQQ